MNERRPKHMLRRSRRLSQVLSSKSPSRKNVTPKKLNKRENLKAKRKSNSQRQNSDESETSLSNGITKQLIVTIPKLTPKSMSADNSESRSSLRSQAKFCSELERSKKDGNVSKKTMKVVKFDKKRGSKKESMKSAKRDNILTMGEEKTNSQPRRSPRLSQIFLAKTPSKKSTTPKKLIQRNYLKAKRQPKSQQKKSVEYDALLGYGICPPGLKPQPHLTCKSRKRKISSCCDDSILGRRTSLRPRKRHCSELKTPKKHKSVSKNVPSRTISNKKRGSKKKQKPRTNESVNNSNLSSPDSTLLSNSFSMRKSPNNTDSIALDDLLFVTSSRKKKSRDITESSGICSAHSSLISSFNTTHRKSKPDDLGFISSASVDSINGSFKIPETKKRPRKKTLKQRRLILNELNVRNAGHEDDLLENIKLTPFKKIFDLDNESEASWNIATPKCGFKLSPFLPKRTPVFKDCFSPTELRISRKNAEEFMHRNKKKNQLRTSPQELPKSKPSAKKSDALAILTRLSQEQKNIERSLSDEFLSDEEKEDGYNSDEQELNLDYSFAF